MPRTKVFVSYSRHDESLVRPLAGLLGVATDDAIFLDVASIKPGDNWKDDIDSALRESSVIVICWCCQAEKSEFIAHEIAIALLGKDKRLVPVLFCDTPLPGTLAAYQWIDLRGQIKHSCAHVTQSTPVPGAVQAKAAHPAPARKPGYLFTLGIAAALMLFVATWAVLLTTKRGVPTPVADLEPPPSPPPAIAQNPVGSGGERPMARQTEERVLVVDRDLYLTDENGRKCPVSEGDVLLLPAPLTPEASSATVIVQTSKDGSECQTGARVSIAAADLKAMDDRVRENLDQNLQDLQRREARYRAGKILGIAVAIVLLLIFLYRGVRQRVRKRKTEEVAAAARTYFAALPRTQAD